MQGHKNRLHTIIVAATLSVSLSAPAHAGGIRSGFQLEILGINSNGGVHSIVPYGISNNGELVSLRGNFPGHGSTYPGYWTAGTGIQPIKAGDSAGMVEGSVSADGSTIVGTINRIGGARAFRWQGPGTFETFDPPAGIGLSTASAVSADGSLFAGTTIFSTSIEAYISTPAGELVSLGPGRVGGMSADAGVVAGVEFSSSGSSAWYWTPEEGRRTIPNLGTSANASATGVSADGSTIFGSWDMLPSRGNEPEKSGFAWSPETGLRNLGNFSTSFLAPNLLASNGDGSVIVGTAWDGSFSTPAVWLLGSSVPIDGVEYLQNLGYSIPEGLTISRINDITDDGLTLVGTGFYNGETVGWIARVPSPSGSIMLLLGLASGHRRRTA